MRDRILAERAEWLTTGDLARMFERTPRGARWIADQEALPCERTSSGMRLFRRSEVARLADRRMEARRRGVRVLRPKKIGVPGQPHQMSLFGAQIRPFTPRPRSRPEAEVQHARSGRK